MELAGGACNHAGGDGSSIRVRVWWPGNLGGVRYQQQGSSAALGRQQSVANPQAVPFVTLTTEVW